MTYTANPTDGTRPLDGDDASGGAAELRALKAYLQGLITGGTSFTGYAWQGFRNKIINGNFEVWQRGISIGTGATGKRYLADKWFTFSQGTTYGVSLQNFVAGQTAVPYEPAYFSRHVVTSVAGAANQCNYSQCIESVRTFAGQNATLSFWAKADANKNIAVEFSQNFGTGGAPSGAISGIGVTTIALTTAWKQYTVNVAVPSITGKTLGTTQDGNLQVIFWFDAGSNYNSRTNFLGQQSGTFDIAQVQMEPGGSVTPFELLPPAIKLEQCQRYCYGAQEFSNGYVGVGSSQSLTAIKFPVTLLVAPTNANFTLSNVTYSNCSALSIFTGLGSPNNAMAIPVVTGTSAGGAYAAYTYLVDVDF